MPIGYNGADIQLLEELINKTIQFRKNIDVLQSYIVNSDINIKSLATVNIDLHNMIIELQQKVVEKQQEG